MEKLTHLHMTAGPAGWVEAKWRRGRRESTAWLRFTPLKNGWWRLVELRTLTPTQEHLRDIPLRKIELAANASDVVTDQLAEWLDESLASADIAAAFTERYQQAPRQPLRRPASRKLGDDFYRELAFAYRHAVVRGLDPAKTLAADTKAPASTVNRWIGETRRRGLLPPTTPGKVSA